MSLLDKSIIIKFFLENKVDIPLVSGSPGWVVNKKKFTKKNERKNLQRHGEKY